MSEHTPLPWSLKPHIMDDTSTCNCTSWCEETHAGGIMSVHVNNGISLISEGGNDAPPFEEAKANAIFIDTAIHSYYPLKEQVAELLEVLKMIKPRSEPIAHFDCQDVKAFVDAWQKVIDKHDECKPAVSAE